MPLYRARVASLRAGSREYITQQFIPHYLSQLAQSKDHRDKPLYHYRDRLLRQIIVRAEAILSTIPCKETDA